MFGFKKADKSIKLNGGDVVTEVKNWYQDRYSLVLLQRNMLVIILIIMALCCFFGVLYLQKITSMRTIKPFVIQVDENSGITTVVDSLNPEENVITRNESIKNYMLIKYVRARETYHYINYRENFENVVRVLSTGTVYSTYRAKLSDPNTSLIKKYDDKSFTTMKVRSIQYNDAGNVATIRFRIDEQGRFNGSYNKIATIKFEISPMTVRQEESFINPIGFKVTSYRVDDEILQ
jgi:type IV secretion system protein VirB8